MTVTATTRRVADPGYEARKERSRLRESGQSAAGRDIGRIPPIADPARRRACGEDLQLFLDTYLSGLFCIPATMEHWPWSESHIETMQRIGTAVREGALFAVAMPRAGGKTSIIKGGALWAILYGYRRWVCIIAATMPKSVDALADIKMILETNPLLAADFPEVCYPIQKLERIVNRQRGQTCLRRPTRITWNADKIVMPDIPGSPAAGATITCTGLDGAGIRGQVRVLPGGTQLRPDLALIDDPQTDDSAKSAFQTSERVKLLAPGGAVMEMKPPGQRISGLMALTVICENDMADQVLKMAPWNAVRQPMLAVFPVHRAASPADVPHGDWWDTYSQLWSDKRTDDAHKLYGEHRCKTECIERLDQRRECGACERRAQCMDADAVVSWRFRKYPDEASAVEHAMARWIENPTAFAAEMQQAPLSTIQWGARITPAQVCARTSGLAPGRVPPECDVVTAAIDIHDEILYWVVAAWARRDFTGAVISYGTFPDQPARWFRQAAPPSPMSRKYPGVGKEGVILAGLEALTTLLLRQEWAKVLSGASTVMGIEKLLIDAAYKPTVVAQLRRQLRSPIIQASRGMGILASGKPVSEYQRRPGWTIGEDWFVPNVKGTKEYPHVRIDTNAWKTKVHNALATAPGDPGALMLYGTPAASSDHEQFAEHIAGSEFFVETTGRGRVVNVWKPRPHAPDNHWLDVLVASAVAASMLGCKLAAEAASESERGSGVERKRYTHADLNRQRG